MTYQYAVEDVDFSDFATGCVFYGLPGRPAFPVRLASEIFQRCVALIRKRGGTTPCVLYDPCCGGASLLSAVAYLHWRDLAGIIGSDVEADTLALAERNLSLLTLDGLDRRIVQLQQLSEEFAKESHREALASAQRLRQQLQQHLVSHNITTRTFLADATHPESLQAQLTGQAIDIVMTDIPYGEATHWQLAEALPADPVQLVLHALQPLLSTHSVVAITVPRQQKVNHPEYQRLAQFTIGKRRVFILAPLN